jgi:hypothetical protein
MDEIIDFMICAQIKKKYAAYFLLIKNNILLYLTNTKTGTNQKI